LTYRQRIEKLSPIEVAAHSRDELSHAFVVSVAINLVDRLVEIYADEHGDLDGDVPGLDKEARLTLEELFFDAINAASKKHDIESYQCSRVGKRTYDARQIIDMMSLEDEPE
jgi:hypothetical protein